MTRTIGSVLRTETAMMFGIGAVFIVGLLTVVMWDGAASRCQQVSCGWRVGWPADQRECERFLAGFDVALTTFRVGWGLKQ